MTPLPTFYKVLGATPGDGAKELHQAYMTLAVRFHPDRPGGDAQRFAAITEAYATLKDEGLRRAYDAKLRTLYDVCQDCDGLGAKVRVISFTKQETRVCRACMGAGFMERA